MAEDVFSREGETINAWVVASYNGGNHRHILESVRYFIDNGRKVAIDSGIVSKILAKIFYFAETLNMDSGVEIKSNRGIIDPGSIYGETLGYSQPCYYKNKDQLFAALDSQGIDYKTPSLESIETPDTTNTINSVLQA